MGYKKSILLKNTRLLSIHKIKLIFMKDDEVR